MVTTYGAAAFKRMVVWTDEIDPAAGPNGADREHAAEAPDRSGALVIGRGEERGGA